MTRGIRAFTNQTFNATLPQLAELGAVGFRREVMAKVMIGCDINVASAATHYNHSLKLAKESNPDAVATLGRPADKKGGRKAKVVVIDTAPAVETTAVETAPAVETTAVEAVTA